MTPQKLGVLDLLDEECRLGSGTDKSFSDKLAKQWTGKNPRFEKPKPDRKKGIKDGDFLIKHFAGEVVYDPAGFLDKNNDALHPDLQACLQESGEKIVLELFPKEVVSKDAKKKVATVGSQFKVGSLVRRSDAPFRSSLRR